MKDTPNLQQSKIKINAIDYTVQLKWWESLRYSFPFPALLFQEMVQIFKLNF